MPPDNRLNTGKGRSFQEKAAIVLAAHFGTEFHLDHPILIGKPPKLHRFDLVSTNLQHVGECKNYSWTETGNVPSAKMGFINEAVFLPFVSIYSDHKVRSHAQRSSSAAD